jgi:DNA-directed RNA polymerase specialized sigma24 family protein
MSHDGPAHFPTTAWSMLRVAQDRRNPEYVTAMNRLIAGYWRPVFYFLRARGYPSQQAEDNTQEFFLRFLERDWLAPADPARGKFRTFLLTILVRFLYDQRPDRAPRQASFERQLVAVSALVGDSDRCFEPAAGETPETIFMRQWARSVIDNVRRRLEAWCQERGRPDWFQVFSAVHFPASGQTKISQQSLAEQLHLSRDQIRYGLDEANARFIQLLRAEVGEQVDSDADIDAEIRELEALLG